MNDEVSQPAADAAGMPPPAVRSYPPREITLAGLLATLRQGLWLLLAVTLACVLVAAVLLKTRAPLYTASMVVAPADRDLGAASRLAADIEQYANLATLAQMPQRVEQSPPIERYLALVGSVPLAERLDAEHDLVRRLFASAWDEARGVWRPPDGIGATITGWVERFFGYPAWTRPSPRVLAAWLGGNVQVTRITGTALRRLELEHPNGEFAAELLGMVHATADALLREAALESVRRQIAHLEAELAGAARPDRREALQAMLGEQYQAEALLDTETPYAAELINPPTSSVGPTSPGPLLVLSLAAVVGVILGVFVVFLRDALRGG